MLLPGQKPTFYANQVTFLVSAIWHGLEPLQFLCFFEFLCVIELSKEIYRSRSLFGFLPQVARTLLAWACTMITMSYIGLMFFLHTIDHALIFAKATNYYVLILVPTLLASWKMINVAGGSK